MPSKPSKLPQTSVPDIAARFSVLSHTEQLRLMQAYRRWADWSSADGPMPPSIRRQATRARDRMVQTNLRLVISLVEKYKGLWKGNIHMRDDLFQEGVIGLLTAIERFDPTRGYTFSTYAYWWIRQAITKSSHDLIRIPAHVREDSQTIRRHLAQHQAEHGSIPSRDWLAENTGITPRRIASSHAASSLRVVSLDAPSPTGDGSLADTVPAPDDHLLDGAEEADARRRASDILNDTRLSPRDREVLLRVSQGENQRDIGAAFNRSSSWVSTRLSYARRILTSSPA